MKKNTWFLGCALVLSSCGIERMGDGPDAAGDARMPDVAADATPHGMMPDGGSMMMPVADAAMLMPDAAPVMPPPPRDPMSCDVENQIGAFNCLDPEQCGSRNTLWVCHDRRWVCRILAGPCTTIGVMTDAGMMVADSGTPVVDASVPQDVETPDVGMPDVGTRDSGRRDSGVDVGTPDVGFDSGTRDTGVDLGTPDTGTPDSGECINGTSRACSFSCDHADRLGLQFCTVGAWGTCIPFTPCIPDAGFPDVGSPDVGQPAADAGQPDVGFDSGPADVGTPDVGTPDVGVADAGSSSTDSGTDVASTDVADVNVSVDVGVDVARDVTVADTAPPLPCNGDPRVGTNCTAGIGFCARTAPYVCNSSSAVICTAVPGSAASEICGNGVDEDCNGSDLVCPPIGSRQVEIIFSIDSSSSYPWGVTTGHVVRDRWWGELTCLNTAVAATATTPAIPAGITPELLTDGRRRCVVEERWILDEMNRPIFVVGFRSPFHGGDLGSVWHTSGECRNTAGVTVTARLLNVRDATLAPYQIPGTLMCRHNYSP